MAKIAKILPLPVQYVTGEMSISNSLAEKGIMRFPGTSVGIVPIKTVSGKYLTGLDENADYILRIMESKEREAEKVKVRERRTRLEQSTGFISDKSDPDHTGLGPKSEYYSGVYGSKYGTNEVASRVKLIDGENVFNFNNPHKEVEFWWVIQNTDMIAPSLEAKNSGKCKHTVQFYVNNATEEAELIYKKNQLLVKANKELDGMSLERRKKVSRLLGLPVTDNDKEEVVFNLLFKFINSQIVKSGELEGQDPIQLFNSIVKISDDSLEVKDLIKKALNLRVYSKRKGIIYEGERTIAVSEDDLIKDLLNPENQMDKLALMSKVDDKTKMKQSIS